MLDIRGFQETSFLDWDGKVCSVVYVSNCNFRCPFCHNAGLIENPEQFEKISIEKIENYLKDHKDFIDGICLTGGEPCLHREKGLFEFLAEIKNLGFLIKLDTNGFDPKTLKKVIDEKLADYIAMDIKAPLDERYSKVAGIKVDPDKIKKSIDLIMKSGINHEFRTTVVPGFHGEKDIEDIAQYIKGAQKFVLQQFVPKNTLDSSLMSVRPYEKEGLIKMLEISKKYVSNTVLRGV